jgi:hypothetical protein
MTAFSAATKTLQMIVAARVPSLLSLRTRLSKRTSLKTGEDSSLLMKLNLWAKFII